jgi:Rod binding domain-containing protein
LGRRPAPPPALAAAPPRLASRAAGTAEPFSADEARDPQMAGADATDQTPQAYRKFESMVLSTFVQSMLPKDAGSVYGEGLSGDMWKSLLAQQLGTVISDRGGIGIADRLLKDHYYEGDTKVALAGVSQGPDKDRLDQKHRLSDALVQELQRKLTSEIAGDAVAPSVSE